MPRKDKEIIAEMRNNLNKKNEMLAEVKDMVRDMKQELLSITDECGESHTKDRLLRLYRGLK